MATLQVCISSQCRSRLYARVAYCPFCGAGQSKVKPPAVPSDVPPADIASLSVTKAPLEASTQSTLLDETISLHSPRILPVPLQLPLPLPSAHVKSSKKKIIWYISAFFLAFASIVIFYSLNNTAKVSCSTPLRNILIVVDFSGRSTLINDEVITRVEALFEDVRIGDRFAIFDTRHNTPIFEKCISGINLIKHSEIRIEAANAVLNAVSNDEPENSASLAASVQLPRQKISQTITDLSLTKYLRAGQNSLHLVSDLLEGNPASFETLCSSPDLAVKNFRKARRGGLEQPEFLNTHVYLHLIPRQDIAGQTLNCRDKYWRWLLANTSGTNAGLSIKYLPSLTRNHHE